MDEVVMDTCQNEKRIPQTEFGFLDVGVFRFYIVPDKDLREPRFKDGDGMTVNVVTLRRF